ncbi:MAG: clostripain-related cysteine peptidase [Chloroflexota bacterium]
MRRAISVLVGMCLVGVVALAPAARAQDDGTGAGGGGWLVMLYQNADDQVLEGDIYNDLNEAELVGSTDDVTIVSQMDRFDGGFDGDGDWTTAKRFLVTQDDDPYALGSQELEDLGEVDSGAPETLVDFAVWAITNFPAEHHALILSDHGAGWLGGWSDNDPEQGSLLSVSEIDTALGEILGQTGLGQLDLVGFDACLMAEAEAIASIAPYADTMVASEETEPSIGWAYAELLSALASDPEMGGAQLAATVVDTYIAGDMAIQDDEQRAAYVAKTFGVEEEVDPAEVVDALGKRVTLSAFDLSGTPALLGAIDGLAIALSDVDPSVADEARTYAQAYECVFGEEVPSPYLDLGSFAHLAAEIAGSPEVDDAVAALDEAMGAMILAEMHGEDRPGSTGISIYVPVPELLQATGISGSPAPYTEYATRFMAASLWDDFLLAHATGSALEAGGSDTGYVDPSMRYADLSAWAVPLLERQGGEPTQGGDITDELPVAGSDVTVAPITVSAEEVPAGGSVTLSTQIGGGEVGFVYVEATRFDEESGTYILEDRDYVAAHDTQQLNGVEYPVWTAQDLGAFDFNWEPTIYALSDGQTEAIALLEPTVYSADPADLEYQVSGTYTFSDTGEQRAAQLVIDGNLEQRGMLTFTGADGTGAARAFQPRAGDTFTVTEQRYAWDESSEGWQVTDAPGDTVTFGDGPLTVVPYESVPGEYSVGIIATDLQAREASQYATVHITG